MIPSLGDLRRIDFFISSDVSEKVLLYFHWVELIQVDAILTCRHVAGTSISLRKSETN